MGTSSAAQAIVKQSAPERSAAKPAPRWADAAAVALFLALAFFGGPLLIAVGLIVILLWRRQVAVRALTVVALVFAVLSLGRTVKVGGRTVLQHGPMSLLDHLQLFDSVVPPRFGLALIPVIAILLAFSVRVAASAPAAWLRYGWTLVLVAVLLPIAPTPVLAEPAAPVPGFFTSGSGTTTYPVMSRFSPWTPSSGPVRSPP